MRWISRLQSISTATLPSWLHIAPVGMLQGYRSADGGDKAGNRADERPNTQPPANALHIATESATCEGWLGARRITKRMVQERLSSRFSIRFPTRGRELRAEATRFVRRSRHAWVMRGDRNDDGCDASRSRREHHNERAEVAVPRAVLSPLGRVDLSVPGGVLSPKIF